jgi:hypothetical protein
VFPPDYSVMTIARKKWQSPVDPVQMATPWHVQRACDACLTSGTSYRLEMAIVVPLLSPLGS